MGGHDLSVVICTYRFLSIIMRSGCGREAAQATRTLATAAQRAARFYIELTLFIRFDLEREVDTPSPQCQCVPYAQSEPKAGFALFVFMERA